MTALVHATPRWVAPYGLYVTKAVSARRADVICGRPRPPLSRSVDGMNLHGIDWELDEGLEVRRHEAIEAAERERLVRELRAARRARGSRGAPRRATGRTSWWGRHGLSCKEISARS